MPETKAGAGAPQARPPENNAVRRPNSVPAQTPPGKRPEGAPKKKGKRLSVGGILCILLILAIAGGAAVVYFDVGGLKATVAAALQLDKPTDAQLSELSDQQKQLEEQQTAFQQTTGEQKKEANELAKREKAVEEKEKALEEREMAAAKKEQELEALRKALDGKQANLAKAADMFANMDAAKAAKALSGMKKVSDIAVILINMPEVKAALILNQMDSRLTTKVATEMTKYK